MKHYFVDKHGFTITCEDQPKGYFDGGRHKYYRSSEKASKEAVKALKKLIKDAEECIAQYEEGNYDVYEEIHF